MKTHTIVVREGEDLGPVDWGHDLAKDMPPIWREAAKDVDAFTFNGREIVYIGMYDGWPYWKPMPAVGLIGPLNSLEWTFFNSYGVYSDSIPRKRTRNLL